MLFLKTNTKHKMIKMVSQKLGNNLKNYGSTTLKEQIYIKIIRFKIIKETLTPKSFYYFYSTKNYQWLKYLFVFHHTIKLSF